MVVKGGLHTLLFHEISNFDKHCTIQSALFEFTSNVNIWLSGEY